MNSDVVSRAEEQTDIWSEFDQLSFRENDKVEPQLNKLPPHQKISRNGLKQTIQSIYGPYSGTLKLFLLRLQWIETVEILARRQKI